MDHSCFMLSLEEKSKAAGAMEGICFKVGISSKEL